MLYNNKYSCIIWSAEFDTFVWQDDNTFMPSKLNIAFAWGLVEQVSKSNFYENLFSFLPLFHNILHELPVFQTVKTINIKVEFKKHLAKVSKERFFLVWINLEDCFKVCLESKSFRSFTIYIYPTCLYVAFRGANIIISVNWTDRLHSRMLLTFFFLESQGHTDNLLSVSLLVDQIPVMTDSLMLYMR